MATVPSHARLAFEASHPFRGVGIPWSGSDVMLECRGARPLLCDICVAAARRAARACCFVTSVWIAARRAARARCFVTPVWLAARRAARTARSPACVASRCRERGVPRGARLPPASSNGSAFWASSMVMRTKCTPFELVASAPSDESQSLIVGRRGKRVVLPRAPDGARRRRRRRREKGVPCPRRAPSANHRGQPQADRHAVVCDCDSADTALAPISHDLAPRVPWVVSLRPAASQRVRGRQQVCLRAPGGHLD